MALLTATLQVDLISAKLNRFPGRRLLILVGHGLVILSHVRCVPSSHSDQSGVFSGLGLPSPSRPHQILYVTPVQDTSRDGVFSDPRIQALWGPKVTRLINPNVVRLHKAPVVANKRSIS
jgi:hypothetical protein